MQSSCDFYCDLGFDSAIEAHLESEVESEDSAFDVRFGDSDDEVGLNDEMGLNDNGGVHSEVDDDLQGGAGSKKPKNKGGRPKKNVDVDEAPSKKRKGRPKKNIEVEQQLEPILWKVMKSMKVMNWQVMYIVRKRMKVKKVVKPSTHHLLCLKTWKIISGKRVHCFQQRLTFNLPFELILFIVGKM
jgi:hypothetical protein